MTSDHEYFSKMFTMILTLHGTLFQELLCFLQCGTPLVPGYQVTVGPGNNTQCHLTIKSPIN